MTSLRRLYGSRWFRYALTLAILALVILKVHPARLLSAAGSAHPAYLAAAILLTLPFLYLKALRWRALLSAARIDVPFSTAVISLLGGMGLALVTPARLGELVRVAYLPTADKWKAGGLVMIDKGFDVLGLALLSIPGAWALIGPLAGLAMAAAAAAGLAVVYLPVVPARLLRNTAPAAPPKGGAIPAWRSAARSRLARAATSLEALNPASSSLYLLLTLLSFVVVLVQFAIILLSWHGWSPQIVLLTFPLVILTNVVPLTVGGLGVRETAAAFLLGKYGVPAADAAVAAFLMFTINTALPGLIGALLLPSGERSPGPRPLSSFDRT